MIGECSSSCLSVATTSTPRCPCRCLRSTRRLQLRRRALRRGDLRSGSRVDRMRGSVASLRAWIDSLPSGQSSNHRSGDPADQPRRPSRRCSDRRSSRPSTRGTTRAPCVTSARGGLCGYRGWCNGARERRIPTTHGASLPTLRHGYTPNPNKTPEQNLTAQRANHVAARGEGLECPGQTTSMSWSPNLKCCDVSPSQPAGTGVDRSPGAPIINVRSSSGGDGASAGPREAATRAGAAASAPERLGCEVDHIPVLTSGCLVRNEMEPRSATIRAHLARQSGEGSSSGTRVFSAPGCPEDSRAAYSWPLDLPVTPSP